MDVPQEEIAHIDLDEVDDLLDDLYVAGDYDEGSGYEDHSSFDDEEPR